LGQKNRNSPVALSKSATPRHRSSARREGGSSGGSRHSSLPSRHSRPGNFESSPSQRTHLLKPGDYTIKSKSDAEAVCLAELQAKRRGLAHEAEPRVLVRRASLDLTGLPPTSEQVDDFLADKAPGAFERLVDRLLASPQFGERWGRHWLDVVGYTDTVGFDVDADTIMACSTTPSRSSAAACSG
jgi:hypothetical protein